MAPMKKIGPKTPPGAPHASDRLLVTILASASVSMSDGASLPARASWMTG